MLMRYVGNGAEGEEGALRLPLGTIGMHIRHGDSCLDYIRHGDSCLDRYAHSAWWFMPWFRKRTRLHASRISCKTGKTPEVHVPACGLWIRFFGYWLWEGHFLFLFGNWLWEGVWINSSLTLTLTLNHVEVIADTVGFPEFRWLFLPLNRSIYNRNTTAEVSWILNLESWILIPCLTGLFKRSSGTFLDGDQPCFL